MIQTKEQQLLNLVIQYKKEYNNTEWYKFKKRNKAFTNWKRTLELLFNN